MFHLKNTYNNKENKEEIDKYIEEWQKKHKFDEKTE